MTKKAGGARYMPALGALGLVVLCAVLLVLFEIPAGGMFADRPAASETGGLETLVGAQAVIRDTRLALSEASAAGFEKLAGANERLQSADLEGLGPEQVATLRQLSDAVGVIEKNRGALESAARAAGDLPELLVGIEVSTDYLDRTNTMQSQAVLSAQLDRMRLLSQVLSSDIQGLAAGGDPEKLLINVLNADLALNQIVAGLRNGDPELGLRSITTLDAPESEALADVEAAVSGVSSIARGLIELREELTAVAQASAQLDSFAGRLAPDRNMTAVAGPAPVNELKRNILAGLVAAAMLIILFMAWTFSRSSDIRRAVEKQGEQSDRNQDAIMRLLDELSNLADGDLTVKATVTEDITGAIADSINYAIEALRELVTTLNESAIMVDGAARQTDATAQQLAAASQAQSAQIEAASGAINSMSVASREISGNAERSSDVARHSVDVAHKGGDAVRRTIAGMNTIRETIQETAKRIKRLGESSQEIGNIVELINDIADQTNILALNASIQASMAGEAGRGFAVVADEVQRLAERSANATKQIEVLVRTIQTDTNEAVVSMERSTTDVVGGALLAENAGAALEEIEQVSNQIASLVQNISGSAKQQVSAATTVTQNMDRLQEINAETAAGMSATTESIRKLAELAAQLRKSVAGFRLPAADASRMNRSPAAERGSDEYIMEQSVSLDADDVRFADQKTA